MQSNMLTFDLVIAMLTFIVFAPNNFYSVMLNMNVLFRQMFLECTKCTF